MGEYRTLQNRCRKRTDKSGSPCRLPYQYGNGSLIYLVTGTRPNLPFSVGKLSRFCETLTQEHCTAEPYIMVYVKGTLQRKVCFLGSACLSPPVFSASDWAGDI